MCERERERKEIIDVVECDVTAAASTSDKVIDHFKPEITIFYCDQRRELDFWRMYESWKI